VAKKFLAQDFSFGCCFLSKQGSWALFCPMDAWTTIEENGSRSLYDAKESAQLTFCERVRDPEEEFRAKNFFPKINQGISEN